MYVTRQDVIRAIHTLKDPPPDGAPKYRNGWDDGEDGWRCSSPYDEECGYRQNWAHRAMLDPQMSQPHEKKFR